MAQQPFDIQFDDREAMILINQLLNKCENPRPLLVTVGKFIQARTLAMFVGRRPDTAGVRGEKWPPLAASTLQAKKAAVKRGAAEVAARPLVYSGKMRDSLVSSSALKYDKKGLVYGTNVKSKKGFSYPGVHEVGGTNGRPPKRRWLFINKIELGQIATMIKDYLEGRLEGLQSMGQYTKNLISGMKTVYRKS